MKKILFVITCFFVVTNTIVKAKEPTKLINEVNNFKSRQLLSFEENKGQVVELGTTTPANYVRFMLKDKMTKVFLLNTGLAYQFERVHYPIGFEHNDKFLSAEAKEKNDALREDIRLETYRMDMKLLGANPNAIIIKEGQSLDFVNYYNHNVLEVKSYSKISYKNIYPNIDWIVYANSEGIKYDFVVHPGGNPSEIKIQVSDAEQVLLNANGGISLINRLGEIVEKSPVSFQEKLTVNTSFILRDNVISFAVANFNPTKTLVIDPFLNWASYYGGNDDDYGSFSATDDDGNVYFAGYTNSTNAIAASGHQNSSLGRTDAFLVKFNESGTRQWATYYGGTNLDYGMSCATDDFGYVYLAGRTLSSTLISSGGHQNTRGGGADAFLVKFNESGTRQWATYYGGSSTDNGYSCVTDGSGNVYLAGETQSTSAIASGGHQNSLGGGWDGFLVKFDSSGTRQWATYYGGSNADNGFSCAVDGNDYVYLAGETRSSSSIASSGHQNSFGGSLDAFLVQFDESGSIQWATYYGGSGSDIGYSCVTDASDNVYLTGSTNSASAIASGGHQNTKGTGTDAFLVQFDASGSVQWATYYGGNNTDIAYSCATDGSENVYISGYTLSTNAIASAGYQNSLGGNEDAFLAKFDLSGTRLWASYYGGTGSDYAQSCATYGPRFVYIVGNTNSSTAIAANGHQNTKGSGIDAFIAKFEDCITPSPDHIELNATDTLVVCTVRKLRTLNKDFYDSRLWFDGDTSTTTIAPSAGWHWIIEKSVDYCNVDSVYLQFVIDEIPVSIDTTLCNLVSGATQTINLANFYHKSGFTFYESDRTTVITESDFIVDANTPRAYKIRNFVSKTGDPLRCPAGIDVYYGIYYDSLFSSDTIFNTTRTTVRPDVKPKSFYSFLWSNNDSGKTTNMSVSGTQWLEIRTAEGCSTRDSFHYSRLNLRLPRRLTQVVNTDFTVNVSDSSNSNAWVVWNNGDTGYSAVYNISAAVDTIVATMYDAYGSVTAQTIVRTTALTPPPAPAPLSVVDEADSDIITLGEINIYPNPSRSTLNISNNGVYTNYVVSDMAGRILLSGLLNESVTSINLNSLSSGTYVIQIQGAADNKIAKFVKVD